MQLEHIARSDLNVLKGLYALLEERHVSRAAASCGLSQPAMSRTLGRLRDLFDDELLVRKTGHFERTPRANALLAELRIVLPRLDALLRPQTFDPATTTRRFSLVTTDYGSIVVVPALIASLAELAPRVRIDVRAWDGDATKALENGGVDLAVIGADVAERFETETFAPEPLVCLVSRRHPVVTRRLSLETYLHGRHVSIDVSHGEQPWIETRLAARGHRRLIALSTPTVASAALAVASSTMICTIGRRMAEAIAPLAGLRIVAAPPELGRSHHCMAWHRRSTGDVAHEWFRERVRAAAEPSRRRSAGA